MASLLQHLFPPLDGPVRERAGNGSHADDDVALGCESAYPALQFDAWEPLSLPVPPAGGAPAC